MDQLIRWRCIDRLSWQDFTGSSKNSLVIRSRLGGNRAQNDERVTFCARVHLMIGRVAAIQNRGAVRIKAKRPKRCPQCKSPYWDVPRLKAA